MKSILQSTLLFVLAACAIAKPVISPRHFVDGDGDGVNESVVLTDNDSDGDGVTESVVLTENNSDPDGVTTSVVLTDDNGDMEGMICISLAVL
ncbi:hypothetical protein TWF694_000425 [Orbilia ellipsospora]|uniref:Uncharacterized protein n=1 Tax=Orbilia ellipsospora TaxID=2528407 RepID=A0AAV9XPF8_9PEZI